MHLLWLTSISFSLPFLPISSLKQTSGTGVICLLVLQASFFEIYRADTYLGNDFFFIMHDNPTATIVPFQDFPMSLFHALKSLGNSLLFQYK
jgi:hypothetical protein